ncbi:hypothetical protein [Streptomyces sp. CC77]|uniref:hypothetical protein n=1 Tax=Streptomyces sp. CC77 TaxID=1906739 RepID=UPI0008DD7C7F|nr:hypothetical protein [Streptomyces sp. CC77]OII64485.1 hypothetical protein BJP39_01785 [Streptomyces sp. CC77]
MIGNHLAQHRELSLLAIGLAVHIQSLPTGTSVDIKTLTARFPESAARIAASLRELEAHGYFRRVRERGPDGRVRTLTYSCNQPGAGDEDPGPDSGLDPDLALGSAPAPAPDRNLNLGSAAGPEPAARTRPASEAPPARKARPTPRDEPAPEARTAPEARPAPETRPGTEDEPAAEGAPGTERSAVATAIAEPPTAAPPRVEPDAGPAGKPTAAPTPEPGTEPVPPARKPPAAQTAEPTTEPGGPAERPAEPPAACACASAPARPPRRLPAPLRVPQPAFPAAVLLRSAADLLAGLRREEPRLMLSGRDIEQLAPGVAAWLERDASPEAVRHALTAHLPPEPLRRPAAFLAHRLTDALPPPSTRPVRTDPLQNCDLCDHAFRAPEPGLCRACRTAPRTHASPL